MTGDPLSFLSRQTLTLEPHEGEPGFDAVAGRAKFHPNTRSGVDRRSGRDRRATARLGADRRMGDRRPKKGWFEGKNL